MIKFAMTFMVAMNVFHSLANAQDIKIILSLGGNREISGELLSVRDSSLIIKTDAVVDSSGTTLQPESILAVRNDSINGLIVRRNSIFLTSVTTGLLAGAVSGALIGLVIGRDKSAPRGTWELSLHRNETILVLGTVFGGLGLTGGLVIGIATPSGDEIMNIMSEEDRRRLQHISRYGEKEPENLHSIR